MQIPEQGEFGFAWKFENCRAMCHCFRVLKINLRHCWRNDFESREIRESHGALGTLR